MRRMVRERAPVSEMTGRARERAPGVRQDDGVRGGDDGMQRRMRREGAKAARRAAPQSCGHNRVTPVAVGKLAT
jgi:hypothetical protein